MLTTNAKKESALSKGNNILHAKYIFQQVNKDNINEINILNL
jgi:hypothetical protein